MLENIFPAENKQKDKKSLNREELKITADYREKNSLVISELVKNGIKVEMKNLLVGDFLIKDTVIERKTISDFISSMINKRLIRQLEELQQYPNRLLIIEGDDNKELFQENSGLNPNATRGFLLSILLKYKVPVIFAKDYEDTAKFLVLLAKKRKNELSIRARKKSMSKKEQLQYILEGFPGIGPKTAKKLLKKYKTIKKIISTNLEELKKEIGKKSEIFKLVEEEY